MAGSHPYAAGARSVIVPESSVADDAPVVRVFRTLIVLGIIWATMGLASAPVCLLRAHQGSLTGFADIPLFESPSVYPSIHFFWLIITGIVGSALSGLLLFGCLWSLHFKPFGRVLLWMWALPTFLFDLGGSYFYVRWIWGPGRLDYSQARGVMDTLIACCGWGITFPLSIAMIYFLTRPSVKDAFTRKLH